MVRLLGIRTDGIERSRIPAAFGEPALVLGSSLTFFGVSFPQVAKAWPRPLVTRSVGGCSRCELETLPWKCPRPRGPSVSIFDLNESSLCDARPALAPIQGTVGDVVASRADWPAAKPVVWSYPLPWLQKDFSEVRLLDGHGFQPVAILPSLHSLAHPWMPVEFNVLTRRTPR